jgi:hypothetical protein
MRQAIKGAAKDLTYISLAEDTADFFTNLNFSQFLTPSYAVQGAQRGAGAVAGSVAATSAIRAALRKESVKVSTKAVSKAATKVGKFAGFAGTALTFKSASDTYKQCMAQ